ncbi:MAG: DNA alkylation repair protein [Candidatus Marinimicrobia bacterium]|nr:DNA alkylation repair protein [Candidatus Neomarinimicrobiota bacterium]
MKAEEILKKLKSLADPKAVAGMARFGINPEKTYGVSIPNLRKLAKEIGKDHLLAQQLWHSGIHEAKILASMIDDPKMVSEKQMEKWVKDFDSWDVCDQVCMNLFEKVPLVSKKINDWSKRKEEFVKRTAYALMACLAWHHQKAPDSFFIKFLLLIKKGATDERNFVKKAVNWALRNIGKRNLALNKKAIAVAQEIQKIDSKSARWIAGDALRELTSEAVQKRLLAKKA